VLVKFQYKSSFVSNNLYIDDINISSQTVGINENDATNLNFMVFPNPSNDKATISYQLNSEANVEIQVIDVLGKLVYQKNTISQASGHYSEVLSKNELNLNTGVYFVKLLINNKIHVQKLIISK
jgi:hypothetical protein